MPMIFPRENPLRRPRGAASPKGIPQDARGASFGTPVAPLGAQSAPTAQLIFSWFRVCLHLKAVLPSGEGRLGPRKTNSRTYQPQRDLSGFSGIPEDPKKVRAGPFRSFWDPRRSKKVRAGPFEDPLINSQKAKRKSVIGMSQNAEFRRLRRAQKLYFEFQRKSVPTCRNAQPRPATGAPVFGYSE